MSAYVTSAIEACDRSPLPGRKSVHVTDELGRSIGFVEIDRVVAGRCCGGIRASADVTARELQRIAEVMTLKCGFVGLAAGGAKGGVIMPAGATTEERAARLEAFGRALAPLLQSGEWSHGADIGTTELDIARIRHAAGIGPDPALSGAPAARRTGNASSGRAAGLTVALCAEAALESLGKAIHDARIAVHGAGTVGRAAIQSLAARGARIVAVSTVAGAIQDERGLDVAFVLDGLARSGDAFTEGGAPPESVIASDCDVLLACAGSASVDSSAADKVRARVIVSGANIPFADGVEARLEERGLLLFPDFVAGGGGVLGTTLSTAAGVGESKLEAILRRHFKPLVADTIVTAARRGTTVADEARRRACKVIAVCEAAYGSTRPPTLLPDRLASRVSPVERIVLALERRVRGSLRLGRMVPQLHDRAVARAEQVLAAALAVGAD